MISRKTANRIAKVYQNHFTGDLVYTDSIYDFLFDNDFSAWFCNDAKRYRSSRDFKEFIMQLHTGESCVAATKDWSWNDRRNLGQTYLVKLATDIWNFDEDRNLATYYIEKYHTDLVAMKKQVELDGYKYSDGRLIFTESDILDTEEQAGLLESMFVRLNLANQETAIHCLKLSEKHWIDENWDDCISNARRFLESTLQEVAAAHSDRVKSETLPTNVYSRPFRVRDYLEDEGLIERQEKSTIKEVYGLLSATGSHPNIAAQDQARLLRQIALIFSHFVMLRFSSTLVST